MDNDGLEAEALVVLRRLVGNEEATFHDGQLEAITALVLEALRCSTSPFLAEGHELAKPHPGQITTARNLRRLLSGSRSTRAGSAGGGLRTARRYLPMRGRMQPISEKNSSR